jgi:hypothetical protein
MKVTIEFEDVELKRVIRNTLVKKIVEEKLPMPSEEKLDTLAEESLKSINPQGNGRVYDAFIESGAEIGLSKYRDTIL